MNCTGYMNYIDNLRFWEYFKRACAIAAFIGAVALFALTLSAIFFPGEKSDKGRAERLERRCADLERRCDSLQTQIDFICE